MTSATNRVPVWSTPHSILKSKYVPPSPAHVLDYLEGPEGELAELFKELGGDRRIATAGERLLADEVAGVDAELKGRLRVGHQAPQRVACEVEL